MTAYYNEIDPHAAAWLRELIKAGHITDGEVDERSIEDVTPEDLLGFTQCHFFAGIGGWSYALRLAGWPDDRPVWTGSCPCQSFSAAGKGAGFTDERHLWPAFFHLINQCRPTTVFGEQVASALDWLDLVQTDMEATGYAFGAADLCAASVSAPHIRQRLYWVADSISRNASAEGLQRSRGHVEQQARKGGSIWLADANSGQCDRVPIIRGVECDRENAGRTESGRSTAACGDTSWLVHGERPRLEGYGGDVANRNQSRRVTADQARSTAAASATGGFWRDADWLYCRDDKWRPVEPGTFPLAHGLPARVGRLRGYGNAIVPAVAAAFITATL